MINRVNISVKRKKSKNQLEEFYQNSDQNTKREKLSENYHGKEKMIWDFPSSPVVTTSRFHCWGHKFNPWLGN